MQSDTKNKHDAAVDWLTVTCKATNGGNRLLDIYNRYKSGETTLTRFFGFECFRDKKGLTWGRREYDGQFIYIAPGEAAAETWRKVVPIATKVTRLDLAVDIWLDVPRDQVKQAARVVMSPAFETRLNYTVISGMSGGQRTKTGDTLYVGSRQSTQFGRFYDKGLQQKTAEPGKYLRMEVEYKGAGAMQISKAALALAPPQLGEWIQCTVYDWFLSRSVVPLFNPATDTPGTLVRSQMKQTTSEKKLAWLHTQVKPTVQYLFEQGLRSETLHALDIEFAKFDDPGYTVISSRNPAEDHQTQIAKEG